MLYYELSFLFQTKSQILLRCNCCDKMFILKVFILIQLLSTDNAKDDNADYFITNSILASRYHGPVA